MLQRHQDQVHLVTRPEVAPFVRRALRPEVTGRLSSAAYETLAIVAYQQPVTRARVEELRGVNCESVLANLELRNLVSEMGRGSGPATRPGAQRCSTCSARTRRAADGFSPSGGSTWTPVDSSS